MPVRRGKLIALAMLTVLVVTGQASAQVTLGDDAPLRFGRFEADGQVRYGVLSAGGVHELVRSFLDPAAQVTGRVFAGRWAVAAGAGGAEQNHRHCPQLS